jgi:DNA (cytosine-5)-methyltransferase 1
VDRGTDQRSGVEGVSATVTDLFCGAGGSSLGAEAAGATLVMAANHWQTAIEVHQEHFPDAGHDCADISQADPRRYPRTQILLASPECTNHSQARGVSRKRQDPSLWDAPDPAAERSRATMWDVVRFAEQIHYDAIVVENVVEATKWILYDAWYAAMESLGYRATILSLNSMHRGVPQSRDRIYIVWTRAGLTVDLELELEAACGRCERRTAVRQAWKVGRRVGRYRQQYEWRCTTCHTRCEPDTEPAAKIIDWSLDCPRIGDRTRPLAHATRARIYAGLDRYGWATSEPLPVQQTTLTSALAAPPGFLFQTAHGGRASPLDGPHPTVCASDDRQALVIPLRSNGIASDVSEVVPTVTSDGNHHGLLMRNNTGGAEMVTPTTEPARTITTAGHQSLLVPYNRDGVAYPPDRPVGTVTTRDRLGLATAADVVDDCGFRMLEPYEVAAAMAFPEGYIPRTLTKRDQVKLAGNAVTPPVMTWIVGRIIRALESA